MKAKANEENAPPERKSNQDDDKDKKDDETEWKKYPDLEQEQARGLSLLEKFDIATAGGVMTFEQSEIRILRLRGHRASIFNNCRTLR